MTKIPTTNTTLKTVANTLICHVATNKVEYWLYALYYKVCNRFRRGRTERGVLYDPARVYVREYKAQHEERKAIENDKPWKLFTERL
jgi:hypothetical protein